MVSMWLVLAFVLLIPCHTLRQREDKTKCPKVKAIRNFELQQLLGSWYVLQYYASSEEALSYRCMRTVFYLPAHNNLQVVMNFTYSFTDDPENELLMGNISWSIPDPAQPAHWVHKEDSYEGVYNTYVIDTNYSSWCLLLHCAEKAASPRYLSSFILGRSTKLPSNVVSFLRDKLPRYDIDLDYMFPMTQQDCSDMSKTLHYAAPTINVQAKRRHPLKHKI